MTDPTGLVDSGGGDSNLPERQGLAIRYQRCRARSPLMQTGMAFLFLTSLTEIQGAILRGVRLFVGNGVPRPNGTSAFANDVSVVLSVRYQPSLGWQGLSGATPHNLGNVYQSNLNDGTFGPGQPVSVANALAERIHANGEVVGTIYVPNSATLDDVNQLYNQALQNAGPLRLLNEHTNVHYGPNPNRGASNRSNLASCLRRLTLPVNSTGLQQRIIARPVATACMRPVLARLRRWTCKVQVGRQIQGNMYQERPRAELLLGRA